MSLAAGAFLGGARSRLLPASLPFRFFAAATAFHVAFWAVLVAAAPDLADFVGGPGPVLAAVHLLTLGVLAMTAIGAALQLLPVATRQPIGALWPIRLMWWLYVPGVAVLAAGMATGRHEAMLAGGALVATGLAIYGVLLADNLRRARGMATVVAHAWAALAALALLAVAGIALVVDLQAGFLADHAAWAALHMLIATYGFMGLLALGFSYILVPMFALSPAPSSRLGLSSLTLALAGLAAAGGGLLAPSGALQVLGAALGLGAAALYLRAMAIVLKTRMRKQLGPSFILVRAAWGFLPASLVLGLVLALGLPVPRGPALFGFALLGGWLLTFLVAILQRIVPFLASMHAGRHRPPPLVSALTPERPLRVHFGCHFVALALVGAGIVGGEGEIVRLGAVAGLVGALAFALFFVGVLRRLAGAAAPRA
jgi:hypothetical protein